MLAGYTIVNGHTEQRLVRMCQSCAPRVKSQKQKNISDMTEKYEEESDALQKIAEGWEYVAVR